MWFNSEGWQAQLGLFLVHMAFSMPLGQSIRGAVLRRKETPHSRDIFVVAVDVLGDPISVRCNGTLLKSYSAEHIYRKAFNTACGSATSTVSSTAAGPDGCRLPCSQFCSVLTLTATSFGKIS